MLFELRFGLFVCLCDVGHATGRELIIAEGMAVFLCRGFDLLIDLDVPFVGIEGDRIIQTVPGREFTPAIQATGGRDVEISGRKDLAEVCLNSCFDPQSFQSRTSSQPPRWPNGVSWRREIRITWRFGDWSSEDTQRPHAV